MYLDVLGRQASSDEVAYWTRSGQPWRDADADRRLVLDQHRAPQRRDQRHVPAVHGTPGRSGRDRLLDQRLERDRRTGGGAGRHHRFGRVLQDCRQYRRRLGHGLVQNILGRDVDEAGLAYWTNYIQTHSKQSVVLGFVTSDEYRLGLIKGWFQVYLGRQLDSSGAQYWLSQMKLGETQEQIQAGILGSAEFRNHA